MCKEPRKGSLHVQSHFSRPEGLENSRSVSLRRESVSSRLCGRWNEMENAPLNVDDPFYFIVRSTLCLEANPLRWTG